MALDPAVQAEEDFTNDYAERANAASGASASGTDAVATEDPEDTPTEETEDPDGDPATDDPEESAENEDDPDAEPDPETAEDDAAPEDDEPEPDEDDDPTEALSEDARKALAKHGWSPKEIKDLPPELRGIVTSKLANIDRAFTRAQTEARAYRKEQAATREAMAALHAERRYLEESPAMAIAEIIKKHPELADEINKLVDDFENPRVAHAFDIESKTAREEKLKEERTKLAAEDDRRKLDESLEERADQVITYVTQAAKKLGLPFQPELGTEGDALLGAIEGAIRRKPADKRHLGLSNRELDTIIEAHHRAMTAFARKATQDHAKNTIRERTRDRRTTTPANRAGTGGTPARPRARTFKNDDEFAEYAAAR